MHESSPVQAWLEEVRRLMRGNPLLARRVLEELSDHLAEAVEASRRSGMSEKDAEEDAVSRLGSPQEIVGQFDPWWMPFKILLLFMSSATVLVSLWLFWVIAVVLPSRDPSHIPMWRVIAVGFLAYSALSWAYLVAGPRIATLRWAVLAVSLGAILLGLYGIARMIVIGIQGGHFEGYIVLMGLILSGHGASAIVYTWLTRQIEKQVRAG